MYNSKLKCISKMCHSTMFSLYGVVMPNLKNSILLLQYSNSLMLYLGTQIKGL